MRLPLARDGTHTIRPSRGRGKPLPEWEGQLSRYVLVSPLDEAIDFVSKRMLPPMAPRAQHLQIFLVVHARREVISQSWVDLVAVMDFQADRAGIAPLTAVPDPLERALPRRGPDVLIGPRVGAGILAPPPASTREGLPIPVAETGTVFRG